MSELLAYTLPPLEERIEEFNKMNLDLTFHMDIPNDQLSSYFLKIRNDICDIVGFESQPISKISNNEKNLHRPGFIMGYQQKHIDSNRACAISIAVSDLNDPLTFYEFSGDPLDFRRYPVDHPAFKKADSESKPIYRGRYSKEHPTLVRTEILHNIPYNARREKRIFFQLCFDAKFDEIIAKNPELFRAIPSLI